MMRINLLPPDYRLPNTGYDPAKIMLMIGVLVVAGFLLLGFSIGQEYSILNNQAEAQRASIKLLQQKKAEADKLQAQINRMNTDLKFLAGLNEREDAISTSGLLEHIALSAEQSGEVWLQLVEFHSTGDVTLRGYGIEPSGMTHLVHRLARQPSFYGIDIESLRRVEKGSASIIEFGARVSPPGGEDDGQ